MADREAIEGQTEWLPPSIREIIASKHGPAKPLEWREPTAILKDAA